MAGERAGGCWRRSDGFWQAIAMLGCPMAASKGPAARIVVQLAAFAPCKPRGRSDRAAHSIPTPDQRLLAPPGSLSARFCSLSSQQRCRRLISPPSSSRDSICPSGWRGRAASPLTCASATSSWRPRAQSTRASPRPAQPSRESSSRRAAGEGNAPGDPGAGGAEVAWRQSPVPMPGPQPALPADDPCRNAGAADRSTAHTPASLMLVPAAGWRGAGRRHAVHRRHHCGRQKLREDPLHRCARACRCMLYCALTIRRMLDAACCCPAAAAAGADRGRRSLPAVEHSQGEPSASPPSNSAVAGLLARPMPRKLTPMHAAPHMLQRPTSTAAARARRRTQRT